MIYIYDFLVNFNDELYSFYEWKETDEIKYLKKSILIKVSNIMYNKFLTKNIIVDEDFLNTIENKTEILKQNKTEIIKYSCVITNGNDVLGIIFNMNGEIVKYTSFLVDDELELLETAESLKTKKITYKIVTNNLTKTSFMTREETEIVNKIIYNIEQIKNEAEKVKYLYYEWFNKKAITSKYYEELICSIKNGYTNKNEEFLKIIELIGVNNNV